MEVLKIRKYATYLERNRINLGYNLNKKTAQSEDRAVLKKKHESFNSLSF